MSVEDSDSTQRAPSSATNRETPHTLTVFDADLKRLRDQLLIMAGTVIENVEEAMRGLLGGHQDLCNEVIAEDEVVDQLEKEIGVIGMQILTRYKPVATDLRRVLSSMNIVRMVERIGDHAVNIAREARKMFKKGVITEESTMFEPLYALAIGELKDAITAFKEDNQELALGLEARDKELDKLHKKLTKSLTGIIEERQEGASFLIHLLFISRSLERIGDLAVNIGEEVVFIESAEDIRHLNSSRRTLSR